MLSADEPQQLYWKSPAWMMGLLVAAGLSLVWGFYEGIEFLIHVWSISEEYGHGFIIPVIAGFFVWQKKNELAALPFIGSWLGTFTVLVGGLLLVVGELSSLYIIIQYAFLVALFGLGWAFTGWRAFKIIVVGLLVLIFMIPLPGFLYQSLSSELQLISSQLGVVVIRWFGISVYLEGNVIDLGVYRLQVVEACSGLRYLFPLTSLAFIAAYLFKGEWWKKAIIFLSSIPITILMNSFRIGVIGVLVEYGGPEQAEGFLHDFEGWVVFMGCMGVLMLEMWILVKIGKGRSSLADAFSIDMPEPVEKEGLVVKKRTLPASFIAATALSGAIAFLPSLLESRSETEYIPSRALFSGFPMKIGDWQGRPDKLEAIIVDVLKFEDYMIVDYKKPENNTVNFYVAYYESQRKGESAHSPKTCIPGGGWQIAVHEKVLIPVDELSEQLPVNRLIIQKGEYKQLVYYWFQGRSRNITNEYMVKWYMFQDALVKNRTDGALVRLTTFIPPGGDLAKADQLLTEFARLTAPLLPDYIPE